MKVADDDDTSRLKLEKAAKEVSILAIYRKLFPLSPLFLIVERKETFRKKPKYPPSSSDDDEWNLVEAESD